MTTSTRKQYLDNLRAFTVLLLFVYHTFMIYNNWGEHWYVHSTELTATSEFLMFCWIWMMPLLFTVAGITSTYALQRRRAGQYVRERVGKLLIPLIFGTLLLVPVQSFIAGLYFNGEASLLSFFTHFTDLTGYDGGFTPGQLWFILYLFVISMIALPFMLIHKKYTKNTLAAKIPLAVLILAAMIPVLAHPILNISGKSIGEYLAYFLLGYFILSDEKVQEKLDRWRFLLLGLFAAGIVITLLFDHVLFEAVSWLGILAILGLGRHYLNFKNKITVYLSKSSYGVYMFHQSWIVIAGYFALKLTGIPALQIILILAASIPLTFGMYEICKRFRIFRWMFGLKK